MISSTVMNPTISNNLFLSELRQINLFFIGFILYSIGYALPFSHLVNYQLCNAIQVVGIILFLPATVLLINFKVENIYLRILIYIYLFYLGTIVFRGFTTDYTLIKYFLFDSWFGGFIYMVPLVSLFPKNLLTIKKIFDTIKIFSIIFLILLLVFSPLLFTRGTQSSMAFIEVISKTIGLPAGFILMTYPYHKMKSRIIAGTTLTAILFLAIYHARRGLLLYALMIFLFAGFVYLSNGRNRLFVAVLFVMIFSSAYIFGTEVLNKSNLFSYLRERGTEDTRSYVEIRFYEDMEERDWIFGRGMNGQFYCPGIIWEGEDSIYRDVIETDFLMIILKGGIISLTLLLLILIPGVFMGLFYSKNLLTKSASIWILIGIINMYPSTVNTFTLNYIMMWVFIGFIFNKNIRMLSERQIINYFKNVS
ncbi:MAG TPA: hypothetical protein VK957_17435 [Lunatimonas sp.]|nr:hypothetical protein [Lunatimonas sp.]